jgi:hypothetical protein
MRLQLSSPTMTGSLRRSPFSLGEIVDNAEWSLAASL